MRRKAAKGDKKWIRKLFVFFLIKSKRSVNKIDARIVDENAAPMRYMPGPVKDGGSRKK